MRSILRSAGVIVFAFAVLGTQPGNAGGHTWKVKEVFSNADGTVQFIEVWEALGGPGETATAGHDVTSNSAMFTIPNNVPPPTGFRSLLLATQAFDDLGVVEPDYIIPENFFSLTADTISYVPLHSVTYGAGQLPLDGVLSLNADLTTGVNSPQNYAGDMGSVDLSVDPPGVPATGTDPLQVRKLFGFPDGTRLRLFYDTATCSGNASHQLLFGLGALMPSTPGGTFAVGESACSFSGSPFNWPNVPDPATDPQRLLWFLIQATDGSATEGAWGKDSSGNERLGPGPGGSSGECGMTGKDLSNTCGQ